ncbi:aspartate carbamoyltransferase PyrB [Peptoclostridium acidaminophilum DSM 3953]|uniref:Aspartate carbamoyltransferase n=1 Tax=Peptoclostridium acidaminophilum DSM 3953 TaxID=1286171 RepID=W8TEK5_PEPAC|nr:aspartate carbamoyltransferase [Peptoclostridium acidaminophilum]AHM56243.1 aspartate carbamoyltransferase PyrB [Peptoclostridium acidaminophilum DSM 3953]
MLKGKHLIDLNEFTTDEVDEILELADKMVKNPLDYCEIAKGRILATLFFEPSTRTRLSFEAAMLRLGGQIIGFSSPDASSTSKGESLSDTLRTVAAYADIIAMRHPKEGAPRLGAKFIDAPIINAGDGGHQHPTQTLTDMLTIKSIKGTVSGLTIGVCGDLKFGRTVHSLIKAFSRYPGNKFILISPQELKIPQYIKTQVLEKNNIEFIETEKIDEVMGDLDILYMTRVQKERFFNEEDYIRLKDSYILDRDKMAMAKEDMIVLHPLPRVNEISYEVDEDERACYFKQVEYGMYARMALIAKLLGVDK